MNSFLTEEIERSRRQPSGERLLREALDVKRDGFTLRWSNLKRQHPNASKADLDRMILEWMYGV